MRIEHLSKSILESICQYPSYASIKDLSEEHKLSHRQTYYQIEKINAWLLFNDFQPLEYVKGKGYFCLEKNQVLETLLSFSALDLFLPNDLRYKFIYCTIYSETNSVGIDDLAERTEVSRNTIISDLKTLSSELEKFDIVMNYAPRTGYEFVGDTTIIRTVFINYFNDLGPSINNLFVNKEYLQLLREIETARSIQYVEGSLDVLTAMIERMRIEKINLSIDELVYPDLFNSVKSTFDFLDYENQLYLYLHLIASRRQEYFIARPEDRSLAQIKAKQLIAEFERISLVTIPNREAIMSDLINHFSISFYRYRYGIRIGNPLTQQIKSRYRHLFEIVKRSVDVLEYPLNEDEIAYITVIFGGNLYSQDQNVQEGQRVVVICPNGLATSKLICREIAQINPTVELTISSLQDFYETSDEFELVVATVPVKTTLPVIYVAPILTDLNKQELMQNLNPKFISKTSMYHDFLSILDKHNVSNLAIEKDVYDLLFSDLSCPLIDSQVPALIDLLDHDSIIIDSKESDYEKLLELLNDILIEKGSSNDPYLENIFRIINQYKTSMFLTDDIFLAHGPIVEGNTLDVALATIPDGIDIHGRQARLIIFLVIEDVESHLQILKDLMDINENCLEDLINATQIEEVLNIFLSNKKSI